jgi:hypothetical protein
LTPFVRVTDVCLLGTALLAVLVLAGCSALGMGRVTAGTSPYTDGSGVKTTVQRTVGGFHAISASGGVTVVVHAGTPGVVSVTADDNLIGQIVTEVRDGTLHVGIEGGVRTAYPPRVNVANSGLDAVSASTGATVEAESLAGVGLSIETSTGGLVRGAGTADSVRVTASTGGNADLRELVAGQVEVQATAGGTAHVYPTESVTGTCTGGSTLLVRGAPARNDVSADETSTMKVGQ